MNERRCCCKGFFMCLISILLFAQTVCSAEPQTWGEAIQTVKKAVVFLGSDNAMGQPEFRASAALLQLNGVFHLLTAKHVVAEFKDGRLTGGMLDDKLIAYFNTTDGTVGRRSIADIKKRFGAKWVFHPDANVDLALLPFGIDMEKDAVLSIPDSLFLGTDALRELVDVFFVSFQPGIGKTDQVRPVYRPGTIAVMLPDKTFYIDGAAFPGNSGSPVFVRPEPVGFAKAGPPVFPAPNSGRFVGVVGEYLPYREVAISNQTGRPRVVFEEHTGLSRVWSTDLVVELTKTLECQNQISHIKAQEEKTK